MKCEEPFVMKGQAFPCGKCLPCLFRRRRIWAHRIMLEAAQYEANAFVTLTYSDDRLPLTSTDTPTLAPEHLRNFLKRLRKTINPVKIRFYAVGEYGDASERPHYHAAIFNFPTCERGRTRRTLGSNRPVWAGCCPKCELVGKQWGFGDVDLGTLETSSAQYVAGYVTKKMTTRTDPRLRGREPEFARMSNRPGIAADALWEIASTLMQFNLDTSQSDVPVTLRHGSRQLPLGRYLRRRLRKILGQEENTPAHILEKIKEEMRPLQQAAFDTSSPFAQAIKESSKGEIAKFHSRRNLFNKGNRHL